MSWRHRLPSVFMALLLFIATLGAGFMPALAVGQLTARSVTLSNNASAATGVTYTIGFTTASTATIASFEAQMCTTASGTCTMPNLFSQSSSTLAASQSLSGTWTVSTATSGSLRGSATGASSTAASAAKTMVFGGVINPTLANTTFFVRITTYSDASWTTPVDTGVAAVSTAGQITVSVNVDESLTFTLASATVTLQTAGSTGITPSATAYGTSTMAASTNAPSGYAITVAGTTLTGPTTLTALATQTASSTGASQFGLNLKANTTPSVGSNPSGGSGAASANYGTADQYRFVTGDTVASAAGASAATTFTVSYIANATATTPAGQYQTVLTYICTPTF